MTEGLAGVLFAVVEPLLDPASRAFWPGLALSLVVAAAWGGRAGLAALGFGVWRHPSSRLDLQLFLTRRLLTLLIAVPEVVSAVVLGASVALWLQRSLGTPALPALADGVVVALYTATLFVAWDLSRYALHRLLHAVPALWAVHQVHHSAEHLTPLTFFRIHPLEAALYALRGAVVTGLVAGVFAWAFRGQATTWTLLGVHGVGVVLSVATGNLRHSHVRLRFGDVLEGWLISPAQHQRHHGIEAADQQVNYGTWLAVWDRLFGTLRRSEAAGPSAFGVHAGERSHELSLVSALVSPLWAFLPKRRTAAVAAVLLSATARGGTGGPDDTGDAAEPTDEPAPGSEEDDESGEYDEYSYDYGYDDDLTTLVVEGEAGVPRTAGSAHVVDEATLERQELDDIHRVVAAIPGVYVRGEDGFGLRPNIGIRGANSDRSAKVALMEDGVLFGPAPYAAPAAYYFPMTTRLVGVEIFKGAASTRFGPNTVGGVVNLRTRDVPSDGLNWGADVAGGSRTTGKLHGWVGAGDERGGVLLEGVHLSTDGFKELDGGGPTGFVRQELMAKGRLVLPTAVRQSLQLKLGYAREGSHETYLGLSGADLAVTPYRRYAASAQDLMQWRRLQAELSHLIERDVLTVRTTVYHHDLDRSWFKLNGFDGGPAIGDVLLRPDGGQAAVYADILRGEQDSVSADQRLLLGTNQRRFRATGVQTRALWEVSPVERVSSRLEVGGRLHLDDVVRVHSESPYDMRDGALVDAEEALRTTLDSRDQALAASAQVHEDLAVGPVRALAGVRTEVIHTSHAPEGVAKVANTRAVLLPGLALHAQPAWWLGVFGGVHRGFSPVAPGQPAEVSPELSWNSEAGVRVQGHASRAEVIGFYDDYRNIAGQCTFSGGCADDQVGRQFNGGRAAVWGVEALGEHEQPLPWGSLSALVRGTYTWTETRFRTDFVSGFPQYGAVSAGDRFPYVPTHQAAGEVALLGDGATLSVAGTYRTAMRDQAGQGALSDELAAIPAALLIDLAGSVQVHEQVRLYGTVGNALNTVTVESWRPFGVRPGRPRQVMVGVKVRPAMASGSAAAR